jgi:ATP adenylyltransferase
MSRTALDDVRAVTDDFRAECTFCAEIIGVPQYHAIWDLLGPEIGARCLLRTTPRFAVLPAIGALVDGHVLIVPRGHLLSIGHLDADALREFEGVMDEVEEALTRVYGGRPVFYENGSTHFRLRHGVSTDHAHMHAFLMPTEFDCRPAMANATASDLRWIHSIHELTDPVRRGCGYLFWRGPDGTMLLGDARPGISQPLRRCIAESLGVPDKWDWRIHLEPDTIRRTIDALSPWPIPASDLAAR